MSESSWEIAWAYYDSTGFPQHLFGGEPWELFAVTDSDGGVTWIRREVKVPDETDSVAPAAGESQ